MNKHTPGPWHPRSSANGLIRGIQGWHGPQLVNVINWNGISSASSSIGQSNARLLTSAPDLLEALQEAVSHYGRDGGPWNVPSDPGGWISRARAAIAKATGEPQ